LIFPFALAAKADERKLALCLRRIATQSSNPHEVTFHAGSTTPPMRRPGAGMRNASERKNRDAVRACGRSRAAVCRRLPSARGETRASDGHARTQDAAPMFGHTPA
jgi:hypothetical protein